uniref:Uncharacterized protein n=1 Tax=Glossina pallidipes TaxID=7398 RepID=A0A1A9ZM44_GLOPL
MIPDKHDLDLDLNHALNPYPWITVTACVDIIANSEKKLGNASKLGTLETICPKLDLVKAEDDICKTAIMTPFRTLGTGMPFLDKITAIMDFDCSIYIKQEQKFVDLSLSVDASNTALGRVIWGTHAETVYGQNLGLQGQFLAPSSDTNSSEVISSLKEDFQIIRSAIYHHKNSEDHLKLAIMEESLIQNSQADIKKKRMLRSIY